MLRIVATRWRLLENKKDHAVRGLCLYKFVDIKKVSPLRTSHSIRFFPFPELL